MSKILRHYWKFEENSILKPYKLGQIIDFEKEGENLRKSTEGEYDYEYFGEHRYLWIITIMDNVVIRIIYRENFPFPNFEFWNSHYDLINIYLEKHYTSVDEDYIGDKMCVISRDGFVNLIILNKERNQRA